MAADSPIVDPFPSGPPKGAPPAAVEVLDQPLTPVRSAILFVWLLLGFAAALTLVMLLPSPPYLRWQQADGTIQFHTRWVYERIHDDPTPIDVAIIGSSRLEAGVSPVELQAALSRQAGRPIHVADLALVQLGRNLHYAIAKDLIATRPELKMIVLSVDEGTANSHPLFKYVADDGDVLASPLFLNLSYFDDLFYLPIRHIDYFVESLAPSLFGFDAKFQPARYLGTNLDRTLGYRTPDGTQVNGMRVLPPAKLAQEAELFHQDYVSTLRLQRFLKADQEYAIERSFTRKAVRLAKDHHVQVVFLHLPMFQARYPVYDAGFYKRLAPYLDDTDIAEQSTLYFDGAHLNRKGALLTTDWLANALSPYISNQTAAK